MPFTKATVRPSAIAGCVDTNNISAPAPAAATFAALLMADGASTLMISPSRFPQRISPPSALTSNVDPDTTRFSGGLNCECHPPTYSGAPTGSELAQLSHRSHIVLSSQLRNQCAQVNLNGH